MREMRRGEIWFGELDSTRGHEQSGRRPVLIISDAPLNRSRAGLVVIVPLTTKFKRIPSHVRILPPEGGVTQESYIKCEEMRSVTKERLEYYMGEVTPDTMAEVEYHLRYVLRL